VSDNFAVGESEADMGGPNITRECMGPRCGISVTMAHSGRGEPAVPLQPYLMPSVAGRHGSMEKVDPAITLTPLGGMVPGPDAIAPAVMAGHVGAFPVSEGNFGAGVADSYPEGCPVPLR
jgi:hypothetical protein